MLSINSAVIAIRRVRIIRYPEKNNVLLCNKYVPSFHHILKVIN